MGKGWKGRLALVAAIVVFPPAVTVLSLVVADWTEVRYRTRDPLAGVVLTIEHGDRLHYVGHLALGRVLDLCGCTGHAAMDQYHRAAWHARTPRQLALVTSDRPRAHTEWITDGAGIVSSGARWGQRGSMWLAARLSRFVG